MNNIVWIFIVFPFNITIFSFLLLVWPYPETGILIFVFTSIVGLILSGHAYMDNWKNLTIIILGSIFGWISMLVGIFFGFGLT